MSAPAVRAEGPATPACHPGPHSRACDRSSAGRFEGSPVVASRPGVPLRMQAIGRARDRVTQRCQSSVRMNTLRSGLGIVRLNGRRIHVTHWNRSSFPNQHPPGAPTPSCMRPINRTLHITAALLLGAVCGTAIGGIRNRPFPRPGDSGVGGGRCALRNCSRSTNQQQCDRCCERSCDHSGNCYNACFNWFCRFSAGCSGQQ